MSVEELRRTRKMTMAAAAGPSVPLVGKKMMGKLGAMPNEAAAAGVSAFARRQMEKMGWSDGKGLGKQEQGMVSHVKVKRREENAGVGVEKQGVEEQKNQWWYNVYDKLADKIRVDPSSDEEEGDDDTKKKKKKSKKDKKRKRDDDADKDKKFRIPTDEELFAATGGKLFGRRAYGSCKGKLKRDELHVSGKLKEKSADGSSDDEKKRKKKKSKKEKKAKKAKRESGSDVE